MTKNQNNRGESLINQLAKESRAEEARMLPTTGDLTKDQLDYVRKMINQRCDELSLNYEQINEKIGTSRKAVRRFMEGNYEHSDSKFARKLDRWLKGSDQNTGQMPTTYVATAVAEKMIGLIKQVNRRKSMGAIAGPSGTSKSTVLQAIESGFIPNSIHIELNSTEKRITPMLRKICTHLGLCANYNTHTIMSNAIRCLSGTDRLLMIDEAHYLDEVAMNGLRDIHKQTGCPIVLVGTQDLLDTVDDFNEFHGQMKSLISMTYNITIEANQSGNPLYTVDEIIEYGQAMNLKLDISGADFVARCANTLGWGGLRSAAYLMLNANLLAKGRVITDRHLNTALREMEGHDGFQRTKFKGNQSRKSAVA